MPASVSGTAPGSACGRRGSVVDDHVALDEIELCCELMIAASTVDGDRLSDARIDEVLRVVAEAAGAAVGAGEDGLPHVPAQQRRSG